MNHGASWDRKVYLVKMFTFDNMSGTLGLVCAVRHKLVLYIRFQVHVEICCAGRLKSAKIGAGKEGK